MESLQQEFGPLRGKRCLVAFSGGADSLFLLEFIKSNSKSLDIKNFAAAHVDHGFRELESVRDFEFCKNYCLKNRIAFYSHKLGFAEGNLESWARTKRYEYLESLCNKYGYEYILTGHHFNDQVETVLMRLDRGTHIRGLRGIHKLNISRRVYRPLLNVSKNEILDYLKARELNWREDLSNQEITFTRNSIRSDLLASHLKSDFNHTLVRIAEKANNVYKQLLKSYYNPCLSTSESGLTLNQLAKLPFKLQNWVIGEFLQNKGLKLPSKMSPLDSIQSKLQFPESWKWAQKDQFLEIKFPVKQTADFYLNVELNLKSQKQCCFEWASKEFVIGIGKNSENKEHWKEIFCTFVNISNLEKILNLRLKQNGDLFSPPNYESQSRKLKKFLQDKKIQGSLKKQLWVLARGRNVLWIPGIATCFQNENFDSNNKIMNRESFWICQKII